MRDRVIQGDYVGADVTYRFEKNSGKNVKVYISRFEQYKVYLNNETVAYCNLVKEESNIKIIPTMISSLMWGHIAGDTGRVYANIDAPRKYRYYIEIELKDGKHFYTVVNENTKGYISKCVDMKKYALGYGVTKYDFDSHKMSEEERQMYKANFERYKGLKIFVLITLAICILVYIACIIYVANI